MSNFKGFSPDPEFVRRISNKTLEELTVPAEIVEKEPDPRYTERQEGSTPLGGDYSIAYFYDKDHNPCEKKDAKYMNIVIYNNDGTRVNEVYGACSD